MPEKRITRVEFPAGTLSPEQPPPTKQVAAYVRISTMKDAQENSFQSQQEYFTEYIQRHPGWVFAGMYADDTAIMGLNQNPVQMGVDLVPFFFLSALFSANEGVPA